MSSSRVHGGKNFEVNGSPKRLEERLSNYHEPTRQPFIYRVPSYFLRDSNDNAHEPRMLAIGPYHHGKQSLKMMEEHKLRYLKSLLLRKNENVDRYISAIAKIEEEARSCYAEELSFSPTEFVEMLVLDGCFIVELVRKSNPSDLIFQMESILEVVKLDLILFENQIPFFILCKLYDLVKEEDEDNQQGKKLIASFFSLLEFDHLYRSKGLMNVEPEEVRHLLHLTHAVLRPMSPIFININPSPIRPQLQLIPSATELKDANVTFCKSEHGALSEVEFNKGVLTLPPLSIGDEMKSLFRNMICYEQYFHDNKPTYVTNYMIVLDSLVNTAQDVEILSRCGIIKNAMGDNQVAADIINRLTYSVVLSLKNFVYADMFDRINAYHKRPWNRAMATLNRDYFNTPWAYISFAAALLLLLLTLAQTVLSAIQLS